MADDAIARARAIAAKLSGSVGAPNSSLQSDLGKRKNRWDEPSSSSSSSSGYGLGLMQSKKVYVPVREHPEINYLGLLIGPRGRSQKELEQRTGARIYIRGRGSQKEFTQAGHPDDDDDLHVCVEGPEPNVNAAMAEIEELLFNPQQTLRVKEEQLKNLHAMNNSLQLYNPADIQKLEDGEALVELEIPNHLVGYLIGKGGENIHKMQSQTGVHVQITKESDMKPGETLRLVVLRGPEEGVVEAKRRVDELVKERLMGNKSSKQLEQMENYDFLLKVPVPNDKVGVIIGKGGNIVKGIQERTHTLIHIPSAPDEDNKATRTLSICGDTRDAVDAAQMEIFVILQQQQQQTSGGVIGGVGNAMYLAVPDERVGVIIGRAGCTIKDIQARYNVKVQIPQGPDPGSQPPVRTISIQGNSQDQYSAKFEIESILGTSTTTTYGGYVVPDLAGLSALAYGGYGAATTDPYAASGGYAAAAYGVTDPNSQAAHQQQSTENIDPTSYYPDFWNYASYYGEAAARAYYTVWSPPEGTPPPPGVTLPAVAAAGATTTGEAAAGTQTAATDDPAAAAAAAYQQQVEEWYRQQAQMMAQTSASPPVDTTETAASAPAAIDGAANGTEGAETTS